MYIPKSYEEKDQNKIDAFIQGVDFVALTCNGEDGFPLIVHLPLIAKKKDSKWSFEGHIPLANPISKQILKGSKVLVVLQGPHGYVSSSVYDHENVPTWNYQIAHVFGLTEPMIEGEMESHLDELVDKFEGDRESRIEYKKFSQEILDEHLYQIKGFRISVEKIEMANKLSQTRDDKNYDAILSDLEKCPHAKALHEAMKNNR